MTLRAYLICVLVDLWVSTGMFASDDDLLAFDKVVKYYITKMLHRAFTEEPLSDILEAHLCRKVVPDTGSHFYVTTGLWSVSCAEEGYGAAEEAITDLVYSYAFKDKAIQTFAQGLPV